jgi:hypothetical protein
MNTPLFFAKAAENNRAAVAKSTKLSLNVAQFSCFPLRGGIFFLIYNQNCVNAGQIHANAGQIHVNAGQIHVNAGQIHANASQIHANEFWCFTLKR